MPTGSCKHDKCEGPAAGKGYCMRHYRAWKLGKLPKARYKICTAEGCRKPRDTGSKCTEHVPVSRRAKAAAAAAEKQVVAAAAAEKQAAAAAAAPAPTEAAAPAEAAEEAAAPEAPAAASDGE